MITEATRERWSVLTERLLGEGRAGDRWLVLTHDNPDPDALASAVLLRNLLRRAFKQRATAAYGGIVGRAENREMVRALHLQVSHIRHLSLKRYQRFALVDTQPRTGNNQLPAEILPDLVIDHHPVRKASLSSALQDIRPAYGATATILGEYMLAAGIKPTHPQATALIYAIRSETQDFSREFTGPDKAIHDHFFRLANPRLLARIQNPRLPLSYFATLHEALERIESVDSLVLSHLGDVDQPDIVPEIADLLLRIEGKTWSLCTGYYRDRLYLSIRTTNPRAEAGALMRRLIGRRGKGGGHGRTAGGWIDAAKLGTAAERTRLQAAMAEKLAFELRKNPDKMTRLMLRPTAAPPLTTPAPSAPAAATTTAPPAAASPAASAPPAAATSTVTTAVTAAAPSPATAEVVADEIGGPAAGQSSASALRPRVISSSTARRGSLPL